MSNVIAAMTRYATGVIDRQPSLETAKSVIATGKAGKKAKKKARKLCQKQVSECRSAVETLCVDDPECLADIDCCELFGQCDAIGALNCLFDVGEVV